MCDQHVCKIIIFRNWSDSANQIFFNPSYIMYFRVWVWLLLVANTPISNYLNWIWNVQLKYAAQNATNTYVVIVIIHELIIHVSFYCCGGWLYVPLKHGAHSPTNYSLRSQSYGTHLFPSTSSIFMEHDKVLSYITSIHITFSENKGMFVYSDFSPKRRERLLWKKNTQWVQLQ